MSASAPPAPAAPASGSRRGRVRPVDFSRPTKFTGDQQRRITRAMETFCQTAGTKLSSELRWPVELEVLGTSQVTWTAAISQQASGQIPVLVDVGKIERRMLMTVEQGFVLVSLEALLGGSPDRPNRERRLSEIDWALTARLLEWMIGALSGVWEELAGVPLSVGEIDPTDAGQVASVSEPTILVSLECRVNQQSYMLSLLVPWIAVEPVATQLSGREPARRDDERSEREAPMRQVMSEVGVTLRAEVAAVHLTAAEVLALSPGDVIPLRAAAQDGVTLFVENTRLARAQPGAAGTRRAVQIATAPPAP